MKTSYLLVLAVLLSACGKSNSTKNVESGRKDDQLVGDNGQYSLLEDKRGSVTYPAMSYSDRRTILDQSRMVLGEIYVNRLKKIRTYGAQIDPLTKLDRFEKEFMNSSPEVFHQELANIYSSQRDHHTWYNSPSPGSCYMAFLPFSLTPAKDSNGAQVSVVKSVRLKGNTQELAPEINEISVGDVLLSINDRSTQSEIDSLAAYNSGSNNVAFYRSAHSLLTFRSKSTTPLPNENRVALTFKKLNGNVYTANLPWLMYEDKDCLKSGVAGSGKNPSENAENTMITEYERFYKTKNIAPAPKKSGPFIKSNSIDTKSTEKGLVVVNGTTATSEPTISWWSFKNAGGTFGVIKLDSFSPEKEGVEGSKNIIANLMKVQMASFDGIIFDLRNNGGGTIAYGQGLTELISAKNIELLKFQLLNTPATRHYFSAAEPNSQFNKELIKANEAGMVMTAAISLSNPDDLFRSGQAFFKPVAIFTNSNCYSTCDMMSALFQDHALAEVWGEDAQTGAGGANNWNYNDMLKYIPKDNMGPFKTLPFDLNLGFAYRQTVRTGIHAGELLEDEGVKADHILETTIEDVVNNSKSQFEKISQSLAAKKDDYQAWANFNMDNSMDTSTEQLELLLDVKATEKIQVFHKKIKIAETFVAYSLDTQTVKVRVSMKALKKGFGDIEIKGLKGNSYVWRKVATIRQTAPAIKLAANEELTVKFNGSISPFVTYNKQDDDSLGWRAEDQTLRLGAAAGYSDNVKSTASLFVDLAEKANATLSFDMEYDTEKDYDFVSVTVSNGLSQVAVLPTSSGSQSAKSFEANLSQFKGQKIEIRFNFQSDGAETGKGVWVNNIKIR